uniref:BrnA antitoxin of type II toxin-antitoxin system n=1 Tax=uncultured Thiotrichaceae bacterium TaxID=298394 RepID=A0A6S6UM32_9GAMM|nr:MAG: Unknown protein [uncultured Thiotrichaceae bacterium]
MPKLKAGTIFPTEEEDAKIREGIAADSDTHELTKAEVQQMRPVGRPKAEVTKKSVTIRLSPEVTDYFRDTGKGWHTRIDQVLRDYVAEHR